MTPSGIEPATFRFVAQHLNHCATAVPQYIYIYSGKYFINTMHSEYDFIRRMHSRRLSNFFLFVRVLFVHKQVLKGSGDSILLPELLGICTFPVIMYSNRYTASGKLNLVPLYFPKSCVFFNTRRWNNFRRQIILNVLPV